MVKASSCWVWNREVVYQSDLSGIGGNETPDLAAVAPGCDRFKGHLIRECCIFGSEARGLIDHACDIAQNFVRCSLSGFSGGPKK